MTVPFEAFVYGWRNVDSGKMYIGYRRAQRFMMDMLLHQKIQR